MGEYTPRFFDPDDPNWVDYERPIDMTNGGYIPGSPVPTVIHPDECLISEQDIKARRWRCSRPGHPTETSDCTTRRHV